MNRKQFLRAVFYGTGAMLLRKTMNNVHIGKAMDNTYQIFMPVIQKNKIRIIYDSATFAEALVDSTIQPGEILMMDDGVYMGDFVSANLIGTEDQPIIIKPRNPGRVVIDGSLYFGNTAWVHFYDIEFMDSRPDRTFVTIGIKGYFTGFGLYGCLIHDMHSSGVSWYGSGAGEIAECVFYNNGYRETDGSGHGHSIYSLNDLGGSRRIARNIFHDNLGRYTIHIYSGDERNLKDFTCEDNIIAGDPVHTGGGQGLKDFIYRRNIQFGKWCQLGRYSYANPNERGLIQDNELIDSMYSANMDCDLPWVDLVENSNLLYGGSIFAPGYVPQNPTGYKFLPNPAMKVWINAFTKSARWLGSLAIFNRDSAESVSVDFSQLLMGGKYKLRNSQNMAETWNFDYTGTPVNVPMTTWTTVARIGDSIPSNGLPVFAAFVIERQ